MRATDPLELRLARAIADQDALWPFLRQYAEVLCWMTGLFQHWARLERPIPAPWRLYLLSRAGELQALLLHQHALGWWGAVARSPLLAPELAPRLLALGPVRTLEGERTLVTALVDADRRLRLRAAPPALSRFYAIPAPTRPGPPRQGLERAQTGILELLTRYHEALAEETNQPPPSREALLASRHPGELYVLKRHDVVQSLAMLMPAGHKLYLRDLYTFPEHRRQGAATALVAGLVETLQSPQEGLALCVEDENAHAIRLYEGLGFVQLGQRAAVSFGPRTLREPRADTDHL